MIELEDITKVYKVGDSEVKAIDNVTLKVKKGDFVFIVGPSGSGKTTLLEIMGGLMTPTKGRVIVDGKDISKFNDFQLSMFRRKRIGFIFQNFNLIPTLNSLENVLVPMIPQGITRKLESRAKELLRELGLGHRVHHTPNQLSGGERQRVAIARALVNDPVLVLADEPTGELDSKTGEMIMDYLRKLNKEENVSFVIVTHDTEYIKPDDTVYLIKDGTIRRTKGPVFKPKK